MALLREAGRKFVMTLVGISSIVASGILNHFLSGMPGEAVITGIAGIVLGYFGINFAQKTKEMKYDYELSQD